ncbi:hypothetical protein U9M48_025488 [Paspalum notatum var. saurae]|uniref:Uncharacterized protein n=1 Tax=Paspalum notatum var. saurae TaxID=547442 RepID=A0AAQ3TQH2_PASNO
MATAAAPRVEARQQPPLPRPGGERAVVALPGHRAPPPGHGGAPHCPMQPDLLRGGDHGAAAGKALEIRVSETGWPSQGDEDGASSTTAYDVGVKAPTLGRWKKESGGSNSTSDGMHGRLPARLPGEVVAAAGAPPRVFVGGAAPAHTPQGARTRLASPQQ